jgi:hypothetical protein
MAGSIAVGLVMINSYDGVKIGLFKYDMTEGFVDKAKAAVTDICGQKNFFNKRIPNSPIVSFWNVNDNGKRLYELPEFREYINFVKPHIQEYLKELGIQEDDAVVTAMWGVHYKHGEYVKRHNHIYDHYRKGSGRHPTGNDVLAILLYLNKPDKSGNLFIESDNGKEHEFDLKGGDVIMFPSSSAWHRTDPNQSNEDKFVVGIEIVMKWVTDDELVGKSLEEL